LEEFTSVSSLIIFKIMAVGLTVKVEAVENNILQALQISC
jgi:hypothetical protein